MRQNKYGTDAAYGGLCIRWFWRGPGSGGGLGYGLGRAGNDGGVGGGGGFLARMGVVVVLGQDMAKAAGGGGVDYGPP